MGWCQIFMQGGPDVLEFREKGRRCQNAFPRSAELAKNNNTRAHYYYTPRTSGFRLFLFENFIMTICFNISYIQIYYDNVFIESRFFGIKHRENNNIN